MIHNMTLELLTAVADYGRVPCKTFWMRRLWYKGYVRWCSPTEVELTSKGLAALYRHQEENA